MNAHDKGLETRTASLFRNGRSQAVRIPKEFEFEGNEVLVTRGAEGRLILEPVKKRMTPRELVDWLRAQPPIEDDFPEIDDFPPNPVDIDFPR